MTDEKGYSVCSYCVATKGLKGTDTPENCDYAFNTQEEFAEHMESEHHTPVQREGETSEECHKRFDKKYPEAKDPKTCKCPSCQMKRGDPRHKLVGLIRGMT